jgi:uncharacterized membrane protein YesL
MWMIWNVIKQSTGDIWEDILYLIIFNVIWFLGSLLIITYPFVTFGLFFTAYDIGQGKSIKFSTFFGHGARTWKQAYIWGGINLGAAVILWININFYANIGTQLATIAQIVFVGIAVFWGILQLVILPLYPRLEEPGFKVALRNAAILAGRYPLAIFVLGIIVAVTGVVSSFFPVYAFLGAVSIIAVVANRMVGAMVEKEMEREA